MWKYGIIFSLIEIIFIYCIGMWLARGTLFFRILPAAEQERFLASSLLW
jgi:hypothetical protein